MQFPRSAARKYSDLNKSIITADVNINNEKDHKTLFAKLSTIPR